MARTNTQPRPPSFGSERLSTPIQSPTGGTPYVYSSGGQAVNRGWDVEKTAKARQALQNASLSDGTSQVQMYVHEVSTDFALAGSSAQSQYTRTFFPRSFVQQAYRIVGQAVNQEDYGTLAEFIRESQHKAVRTGTLLGIHVTGRSPQVAVSGKGTKGMHKGLSAVGYVRNFERIHERHKYAPEYTFDFIVSRHRDSAIYNQAEKPVSIRKLRSWTEIIGETIKGSDFIGYYNENDEAAEETVQQDPGPPIPDVANGGYGT